MNSQVDISKELLDQNIARFIDSGTDLPEKLRNYVANDGLELLYSRTGKPVIKKDGLALQSTYDPEKEASKRIDDVDIEFVEYFVVFGLGMGYMLKEIRRRSPTSKIMVLEPDLDVLYYSLSAIDYSEFAPGEVIIHHHPEDFRANCFFAYRTSRPITVVTDPLWIRMYPEMLIQLRKELEQFVVFSKISENTANSRMRQWIDFLLNNLRFAGKYPSLGDMKDKYKGMPAVICSAGPSLNKNVEMLKGFEDNLLIISVNTAYRALHRHGVRPHLVSAIESYNIKSLFEGLPTKETNFITTLTTNPELFELDFGRTVFFVDSYPVYSLWLEKELGQQAFLDVGGSVACASFSIAKYLGADPIILIGQDLAYTNGQYYAKGTSFEDIKLDFDSDTGRIRMKNLESKERIYKDTGTDEKVRSLLEKRMVPGWHGDMVPTSEDLNFFRTWFESMSRVMKREGRTAINSTEGGAYINGFEHISLKEALERHIVREKTHQFDDDLNNMAPAPDYSNALQGAITRTQKELHEIISLCENIQNQHKIIEANGIDPDNPNFMRRIKELEKREKRMNEKSHELSLLQGYARELVTAIKTDPKAVVDLPPEEGWKMNLQQSKLVAEAVMKSANDLISSMDNVLKIL